MTTLVKALETLKEHVYYNDVSLLSILDRYGINAKLGLYLAREFLAKDGYRFTDLDSQQEIDVRALSALHDRVVCKPPLSRVGEVFGLQNFSEHLEPGPAFDLLNHIAAAGPRGCTSVELAKLDGVKKNLYVALDRLVVTGAVVKRSVMPTGSEPKRCRVKSICVLLHLKKYAQRYSAARDFCQIVPDDEVKDAVFRFIVEDMLDANEMTVLPCKDLSQVLNLSKRHTQYMRNHIVTQNKQGYCILEAVERRCAPLKENFEPGVARMAWCLVKAPPKSDESERCMRIRNLSLIESLDMYLRRRGELNSVDLRRFTATSRKRSQRLSSDLVSVYKYPAVRVQCGRSMQNKITPKPGTELTDDHPSGSASLAVEDSSESIAAVAASMAAPVAAVDTATASAAVSAPDYLMESNEVVPVVRERPSQSAKKRARPAEEEEDNSEADDAAEEIKMMTSGRRRNSVERTERLMWFHQYLQKLQYGVGCILEVSQILRTQHREKFKTGTMDKKTIMRLANTLIENNVIELRDVDLDESQAQNFGSGIKQVELIIVKDFPGDVQGRIEDYLNSYVHIKTVYKKKETTVLSSPVADDGEVLLDGAQPLDYEALLAASVAEEKAIAEGTTPAPKKRRGRKFRAFMSPESDGGGLDVVPPVLGSPEAQETPSQSAKHLPRVVLSEECLENIMQHITRGEGEIDAVYEPLPPTKPRGSEPEKKTRKPGTGFRDPWTPDEIIILIGTFLDNYFVRKARLGLPPILKPANLKRMAGVKSTYVIYPWKSVFDTVMLDHTLSPMRPYYFSNAVSKIRSHSVMSTRKRAQAVSKTFHDTAHLVAFFLWETRGDISIATRQTVDFLLKRESSEKERPDLVMEIISDIFKCMEFRKREFSLTYLLKGVPEYDALVPKVMRELYMHGVLRSIGNADFMEDVSKQKFKFPNNFMNISRMLPLGGFITQMVENLNDEEEGLNDIQSMLFFLHSVPCMFAADSAALHDKSPCKAEITVQAEVIGANTEKTSDQEVKVALGNKDLATPFTFSTEDSNINTGLKNIDRVEAEIRYTPSYLCNLENAIQSTPAAATAEEKKLPWYDNEGNVNAICFRFFATEVLIFLTEFPHSTLAQVHAKIIYLAREQVRKFLEHLVSHKVLNATDVAVPVKLKSPFDAHRVLWNRSNALANPIETTRFYSLNFSP